MTLLFNLFFILRHQLGLALSLRSVQSCFLLALAMRAGLGEINAQAKKPTEANGEVSA
jgi:hypothetical protein